MERRYVLLASLLLCHLIIVCPSCGKKKQDKEVAERRDDRLTKKNITVKNEHRNKLF